MSFNINDAVYNAVLTEILEYGENVSDRTGVGTRSVIGLHSQYFTNEEFPLITTKKIHWKSVVIELLWMLQGRTNIDWLKEHKVTIWNEWADKNGELGPVYGSQWRDFGGIKMTADGLDHEYTDFGYPIHGSDQLAELIYALKRNPDSRRHILNAWNPSAVVHQALPPCHVLSQYTVRNGELHCSLYQRSADAFLGVPFNVASYGLMMKLLAAEVGLRSGVLNHYMHDAHLYQNHLDLAHVQLDRPSFVAPKLEINLPPEGLLHWIDNVVYNATWEEIQQVIKLKDYKSHPAIKAEVAV